MEIELLNASNFIVADFKKMLKTYVLEDFYLKSIKRDLNFEDFIDFKVGNVKRGIENGGRVWQIFDKNRALLAIIGLRKNESRSKNFGLNYYEFGPMYNFSPLASKVLKMFEEEVLEEEVKKLDIQYLKTKVHAGDYQNIAAFSQAGYAFLGTSLNLYLDRERFKKKELLPPDLEFVPMEDKYILPIQNILSLHNHNEDFYDVEIEDKDVQCNFGDWLYRFYLLEENRKKYNKEIVLLRDKNSYEIVGFSCYTKEPGFSKRFDLNLITRDLTVVPKTHHGKGYGSLLFNEIMKREQKNVELKLMSNNYKAISFNHHNGFRTVSSAHYFRKKF